MDTSSESESWDRSQRHSFKRGEAHCRPSRDNGSSSDQAGHVSKKFQNLMKTLQGMKRHLSKVDQRLELYRDKTEVTSMLGEILKESNTSTSERQVLELKRAMDEMERDQLNRVEKLSSELEELREIYNRGQMERREMEASLLECKSSKDEIRSRAIKDVRHWKAKCKRIQAQFQTEKVLQAAREKESFQDQFKALSQQTDKMHIELNEVLSRLAQHKEDLHHKSVELCETSQLQLSLKQETQELRETLAALKEENQSQAALQAWLKEHQRLEEQTVSEVCCCQRYQDMSGKFQTTLKKMTPAHAQIAQQLAKEESSRKELQRSYSELKGKLTVVQEERAALKLQLEKEMHQKQVHNMKAMKEDSSIDSDHEVPVKIHLKEVKSCREKDELSGVLRAMLRKTKNEMAAQLTTKDKAYALLQKKCQQLQQELDDKIRSSDQRHISELEGKLLQKKQILTIIDQELDATCRSLASNCKYKQEAILQSPALEKTIHHWLAETITKLRWLCEEMRESVTREERLRKQLQQTRDQLDQQENLIQSSSTERESWQTED